MTDDGNREGKIAMGCFRTLAFVIGIAVFFGTMFNSSDHDDRSAGKSATWERYDVEIDVQDDGILHVVERQEVRFDGRFSQGYAVIPLDRIESIDNVRITTEGPPRDRDGNGILSREEARSNGRMLRGTEVETNSYNLAPGDFTVAETNGEYRIDYGFEPTWSGVYSSFSSVPQVRTIVLEYDVTGAIRDYPDAAEPWQQLHWMAISSEVTDVADVGKATVTITLPEDVPVEQLAFAPEPESVVPNRLVWSTSEMGEGDSFDVQVAFPAITSATAPAWQPAADARDADIEAAHNRQSLASVMLIGAGILVVVGGGLALLYAWYSRIHESVAGLVPEIVSEPPDDLPVGLVGALVDEQVHPRDIAAAIMDLDRRGIVRIKPNDTSGPGTFGRQTRYALELAQPIGSALPYEQAILNLVFQSGAEPPATVSFDALRALFGPMREDIQRAMDEELVRRGYLDEMPETSRRTWERRLKVFVGLTVVIVVAILIWTRSWTWWVILPPALGCIVYLIGKRLTPSIARKTREGAEVSAHWKAFQRYLESTGNPVFGDEWKKIGEEYTPWLVAFGIDNRWLGEMNTPLQWAGSPWPGGSSATPSWSRSASPSQTTTWGSGTSSGTESFSGSVPGWSGWDASRWATMQGGSNNILGAISSSSESLFSMMGDAMEAMGSSSGSGGGRSGGRSFGGSSRSGGRSRSSSGGGSRGFR